MFVCISVCLYRKISLTDGLVLLSFAMKLFIGPENNFIYCRGAGTSGDYSSLEIETPLIQNCHSFLLFLFSTRIQWCVRLLSPIRYIHRVEGWVNWYNSWKNIYKFMIKQNKSIEVKMTHRVTLKLHFLYMPKKY